MEQFLVDAVRRDAEPGEERSGVAHHDVWAAQGDLADVARRASRVR
ncbi:hypothetical protein ACWKT5_24240 [Streptomyces avermitilis]